MTQLTSTILSPKDRILDKINIEIKNLPLYVLHQANITLGTHVICMSFEQFEEFIKLCIHKTSEEYQRRVKAGGIKSVKEIAIEVGSVIPLSDSIGGEGK